MPIDVLIVDDHGLIRQGLGQVLGFESDLRVVGEAGDGQEALAKVDQLKPHVVLMDINMPRMNGLEAARRIKARHPEIAVLALTIHDQDEYLFAMLEAGASGYLLKDGPPEAVIAAVRAAAAGQIYLPPGTVDKVVREYNRLAQGRGNLPQGVPESVRESLTERELEVLGLIVGGKSNQEIAEALFISEKTVKNHVSHILQKLDVTDRTQAAVYAIRVGLVRV